jgi:hypothetical protein
MADRENNKSHQPPEANSDEQHSNYYPRTPAHPYEFLKGSCLFIFQLLTFLALLVLAIFLIILLAFKLK